MMDSNVIPVCTTKHINTYTSMIVKYEILGSLSDIKNLKATAESMIASVIPALDEMSFTGTEKAPAHKAVKRKRGSTTL